MSTSGGRDYRWASKSALKDFTEDALTISAGSLFQNGTARFVKANWRRRVQHLSLLEPAHVALCGLDVRR